MTGKTVRYTLVLIAAAGAALLFARMPDQVFNKTPLDWQLYVNQKIFYYHVPAIFMMFLSVFVCGIASAVFLAKRSPASDDVASAGADLVVVFGATMLVTGPIWAKAAWGVYWVWDARLTSALLLWMVFVAYGLVRRYGGLGSERLAAGLAVFGTVNVPLVYFAVNFWKTQHPTNKVVPGLEGEMKVTFRLAILAFFCLWIVLLAARVAIGRGQRRLAVAHDVAVENGYLD
jgi:heme exporter protein C